MMRMMVWMLAALVAGAWSGAAARGQDRGSIIGWGGQVVVPESDLTDLVAVAGGGYHSLGLKADGSIVAWGYNYYGQCNVPAPNTGFVAVAGGGFHSLGLKADGSIVAWGLNRSGQTNVPAPNTGFVAVAGGALHSLGLKGVSGGECVREPAWVCDGDVDGDGTVNPIDVGLVQAAFCAAGDCSDDDLCQYDIDCNGAINPVDVGLVQSLFGTCEAPRSVCP
jgi:hypothetical protein